MSLVFGGSGMMSMVCFEWVVLLYGVGDLVDVVFWCVFVFGCIVLFVGFVVVIVGKVVLMFVMVVLLMCGGWSLLMYWLVMCGCNVFV